MFSWDPISIQPIEHFDLKTELIFLVFIRGSDREARDFIRKTLGQISLSYVYQVFFVFGSKTYEMSEGDYDNWRQENALHSDIIVSETEDSYYTVILKEISAFQWIWSSVNATQGQNKLKWVVKIDDDVILNPVEFNKILISSEKDVDEKQLICRQINARPVRKPASKWYIPYYIYPENSYPPYCYGPLYILTVPTIETTLQVVTEDFKQDFLWLEDVYLTGSTYTFPQVFQCILNVVL